MSDSDVPNKLSINGNENFLNGLTVQYPGISSEDAAILENDILFAMGKYMGEGFLPAVARANSDGTIDLKVFDARKNKGGNQE